MLRATLAVLAAVLLVGVMSVLIVESRAVKEDYYVAHAERMRAIEITRDDLTTIIQGAQDAFDDGRPMSASVNLAFARLAENNELLQEANGRHRESPVVDTLLQNYDTELTNFVAEGQAFAVEQNAMAEALETLQDESPLVVKDLRRFNFRIQSQNAFSLAIDIIEFATGKGANAATLRSRISELRNDRTIEAQAPGRMDAFAAAANEIISRHIAAGEALARIGGSGVTESLWALSNEILNQNRRTVSRAERARLLLSVCAVLLLLGTGFAMWRLQTSYRALNRSNRELEKVNSSLEERVDERTEEVSKAYNELKESQVQLVQAEKMSSLGELVAGISHEINTPLWYLMSNASVLQERMEDVDRFCAIAQAMIVAVKSQEGVKEAVSRGLIDMQKMLNDGLLEDLDEAKDLLKDSVEGLEELTELAQSLKDFSRLDRARNGEFNVNDGLDKTLLIAKNKLKSRITVHKYYGDIPLIHCSPSQINQIFLNLLTNAADAIQDTGDIVLRTTADKDRVRISVADTGCGIPAEVMAKVRDPFFTTKAVGKGTGLGLSIVDQIVSSHGGELLIESQPGKGTTVTIVLPVLARVSAEEIDEQAANDAAMESTLATDFAEPEGEDEGESKVEPDDDVPEAASV